MANKRGITMTQIILTTESGADLPAHLAEKYSIHVFPTHVILDGREYLDVELSVKEIFSYYDRKKIVPSTAATNSYEYEQLFSAIRQQYPTSVIIHIGYSSRASASFQNAVIAAKKFDSLYLIDTLNVTGGLTAIVLYAAEELAKNPTIEPQLLIEKIEAIISKSRLAIVPGGLVFLKAGGRVSNFAYIGGELLKIKPCIELIEGKLVSTRKYRGKMETVADKLMTDYLKQYPIDRKRIFLLYSLGLSESIKEKMHARAMEEGFEEIIWMEAGAVISSHAGPGGFGIAGIEQ